MIEQDNCPFNWSESDPNCRIYDPAFYDAVIIRKASKRRHIALNFGMRKGEKWGDVPSWYLLWIARSDLRKDIKGMANLELAARKVEARKR